MNDALTMAESEVANISSSSTRRKERDTPEFLSFVRGRCVGRNGRTVPLPIGLAVLHPTDFGRRRPKSVGWSTASPIGSGTVLPFLPTHRPRTNDRNSGVSLSFRRVDEDEMFATSLSAVS